MHNRITFRFSIPFCLFDFWLSLKVSFDIFPHFPHQKAHSLLCCIIEKDRVCFLHCTHIFLVSLSVFFICKTSGPLLYRDDHFHYGRMPENVFLLIRSLFTLTPQSYFTHKDTWYIIMFRFLQLWRDYTDCHLPLVVHVTTTSLAIKHVLLRFCYGGVSWEMLGMSRRHFLKKEMP